MGVRNVALVLCLTPAWMLTGHAARAGMNDILVGLDEKVVYDANGQTTGPGGKDAVLVMDVTDPAHPKIRASLPLANSLLGPPTNLQITPNGKLALVANSVVNTQDGATWKAVPDDKLYVIDLTANPPKLIDTVTVGKQPSGLMISHRGDLALIGNRAGKSVSVVAIDGMSVKAIGEVPMDNEVAAVAITPDGKYVVSSHTGAQGNNADAEVTIDTGGAHPHVVAIAAPGTGAEGFAISPNGKWAASALIEGSGAKHSAWNYTKGGHAALMAVAADGKLTVVSKAPIGALPEGIAFSPKTDYVYIGNYIDKTLQVFHIVGGRLVQVGTMALPGQPASMRGVAR
jgi:DNA-binding beta-propeller fold protein YncE